MKYLYLRALLVLAMTVPATAFAQDEEQEGDETPAPETPPAEGTPPPAGEGTTEGEDATAEGTSEDEPEPEVSATAAGTTAPTPGVEEDLEDSEGQAAGAEGEEGATDPNAPPPPPGGGGTGLRFDLETGRWVEDTVPLPWRNTLLLWDHSVNAYTFFPESGLSYNPTYIQTFSLRPRWYLSNSVSIRLREDLAFELTESDWTTREHDLIFSDFNVNVTNTTLAMIPGEIAWGAGLNLWAPVSIASRNCNMILGVGGTTALTKVFGDVLSGLTLQPYGSLRYNFHSKNVCTFESDVYANADEDYGDLIMGGGGALPPNVNDPGSVNQPGGSSNADLIGTVGLYASLAIIPEISFNALYQGTWSHGRGLDEACFTVDSDPAGMPRCIPDDSLTHLRVSSGFSIGFTWLTNNWLNLSISWNTFTSQLAPNGKWYNPFYTPQTTASLTATFVIDEIYNGVSKMLDGDEEAPPANARRSGRRTAALGTTPSGGRANQ